MWDPLWFPLSTDAVGGTLAVDSGTGEVRCVH